MDLLRLPLKLKKWLAKVFFYKKEKKLLSALFCLGWSIRHAKDQPTITDHGLSMLSMLISWTAEIFNGPNSQKIDQSQAASVLSFP